MTTLILQPTVTAEWHALVKAAEDASCLQLNENLESYLVFLLMRFNRKPEMAVSVLAQEFLQSFAFPGVQQKAHLQDVGDKCLLFSGLFPGRAERRRVKVSYFVELGQSAYAALALRSKEELAKLYLALGKEFVVLMDVLHAMRNSSDSNQILTLLQATELWADTQSQQALAVLRRYSAAFPVKQSDYKH